MFALEISFQDGVSQPEMVFVRRPHALLGASDFAHVVIEDMRSLNYQLRLVRDLGRRFRCKPVGGQDDAQATTMLEGVYEGEASFELGPVKLQATSLDADLLLKETEPPDRAGVRVLRQACAAPSPLFPAIAVLGANPMVISFVPDQPVYIGRSKHCALRLDSADISAKHARMGYESGEFWIEDLGSTNGTFVNEQQISGRVTLKAGVPIILGREISIIGVTSEDQIRRATRLPVEEISRSPAQERRYPVLISVSEVARPARLVIPLGATLNVGRDPGCDMWLGAPHISRKHCTVSMTKTGALSVCDFSTNGTAYDEGILRKGDLLDLGGRPRVLDFGGGVTVALCFDEEQEQSFIAAHGAPTVFVEQQPAAEVNAAPVAARPRRDTSPHIRMLEDVRQRGFSPDRGLGRFLWLYRSHGLTGRVLFIVTCFAFVVFLVIISNLLFYLFV